MNQKLSNDGKEYGFGLDSVIIAKHISDIKGGRTLDLTGFDGSNLIGTVIPASWPIITNGSGVYKPLQVASVDSSTGVITLAEIASGFTYAGVLYRSISKADGAASILTQGEVNVEAVPFDADAYTAIIKAMNEQDSQDIDIQLVKGEDSNAVAEGTDYTAGSGSGSGSGSGEGN